MLVGVDATGETICEPMCVDSQSQSLEHDDFGTSADQSVRHLTFFWRNSHPNQCVVLTDQ